MPTSCGRRSLPSLQSAKGVNGQGERADFSPSLSQPSSSLSSTAKQSRREREQVQQDQVESRIANEVQVNEIMTDPHARDQTKNPVGDNANGHASGFTPGEEDRASDGRFPTNLSAFRPAEQPNFRWGAKEGVDFAHAVRVAYEEVVHWRRNVFLLPSGKVGKEFIRELTRLFNAYTGTSALESVVFDSIMLMCVLLLQKPHVSAAALERRLRLGRREILKAY